MSKVVYRNPARPVPGVVYLDPRRDNTAVEYLGNVRRPFFSYRKVGGLHHWRAGRFGGSFYASRQLARPMSEWKIALHADRWLVRATVVAVGTILMHGAF